MALLKPLSRVAVLASLLVLAAGIMPAAQAQSVSAPQKQQPSSTPTPAGAQYHSRNPSSPRLCSGPSCQKMSDLLPQLKFRTEGFKISCTCADFFASRCFAPGCFPCDKSCFASDPALAKEPGPFGTGLLCSSGCNPCCQKDSDPNKTPGASCSLVGDC